MQGTGLICNKCGFKNLIGEKYCSECGSYLLLRNKDRFSEVKPVKTAVIYCSNCNNESTDNKKYCSQCGYSLNLNNGGDRSYSTSEPPGREKRSNTSLLEPGALLQNRYKITKLIGQGGMGAIYLADDTRFSNRVCVIKEMLDNFSDEEQRRIATSNFLREADLLASLHHDGIPEVYDRFSEGNRHYLVMEYIKGEDLEKKLEEKDTAFDDKTVLGWAVQICDILSYLHNQKPPIIYRDMKPANLILTRQGKIYMVDFGIARFFNPVKKGTMVGTQGYAPPEQYRGMMEPRSDIFALGATMHHLLTRRDPQEEPPFSFPPVRKLNSAVSVATEKLIEKALEKDVSDRFENAEDMLRAIMRITANSLDSVKICPYCNNKVSTTKQFCPYCNEYIASYAAQEVNGNRSLKNFFLSPKFLIGTNVIFIVINIVLVVLLLQK